MFGRSAALTLLACVASAGALHAHRLEVDFHVLPDRRVQIESWFDLTGDSPRGARVQVFRPDGQLLTEGLLNDEGIFVFAFHDAETLRVVVSAGAGHRAELTISPAELTRMPTTAVDPKAPSPAPLVDRSPRVSFKDVLTGVGFLLALAAFVLSLRNARQLRALKDTNENVECRTRNVE